MGWFIFSEVMFFAAFFGALFYGRMIAVPDLAAASRCVCCGRATAAAGRPSGRARSDLHRDDALGHSRLEYAAVAEFRRHGDLGALGPEARPARATDAGPGADRGPGPDLPGFQAYEYHHAYTELGLTPGGRHLWRHLLMLTGFHGLHVTIGSLMLLVILGRSLAGHFGRTSTSPSSGVLVLALRGRGVAAAVRVRVLVVVRYSPPGWYRPR